MVYAVLVNGELHTKDRTSSHNLECLDPRNGTNYTDGVYPVYSTKDTKILVKLLVKLIYGVVYQM